ncbi:MAG: helix-turn-helix domain-containing protein [Syntrophorhabdales bacterium]|jgi:predicted DNA-binding transcriptional regulator AlpA
MPDEYLTDKEVAKLTKRAVQTLRNERTQGKGFPYVRIGRSIRYRASDVIAAMEALKIIPGR